MDVLKSYDVQAILAILFNGYSILIFLCILVTLPGLREKGRNYRLLLFVVIFGILASLGECFSYANDFFWKSHSWGKIFSFTDLLFICLFRGVESVFILNYTDSGLKINKIARHVVYPISCILLLAITIPPAANQIYYIPENGHIMEYGPFIWLYSLLALITVGCSVIVVFVNRKKIGYRATVVLLVLQITGIVTSYTFDYQSVVSLALTSIIVLIFYISIYQRDVLQSAENDVLLARQRLELSDMKTKVVLSQVKPHFIYNTLSSIAMLCTKDPSQAKELTLDFSEYLRNNLDTLGSSELKICTFAEELEHVKTYLNIETFRFGDRLKVEYDIMTKDFEVPALSIQPIVENAVKHGVCKKPEGGTVLISTEKCDDGYLVIVKDDGVGFDPGRVADDGRVHIGLRNIEKRIALAHGRVTIDSTPGAGTMVTVFLRKTEA